MAEPTSRTDSWVQWALLIGTIIGALWNLSGRLSSIEQQLSEDGQYHAEENRRIERLEQRFIEGGYFRK